jgi:MFS family permease
MLINGGSSLGSTLSDQLAIAQQFWNDPRFHAPILVIWVASFGGALHDPVTTFFYLKLGATTADIGKIGWIKATGVFLNPIYGYFLDKHSPFWIMMLSSFLCAFGCLIRGLAPNVTALFVASFCLGLGASNLWTIVLSFIATNTPPEQRSSVISAYLFQVTTLTIAGKSLYTPLNWVLLFFIPAESDSAILLRYRFAMGICTFFCIFGVFYLAMNGEAVKTAGNPSPRTARKQVGVRDGNKPSLHQQEEVATDYVAFSVLAIVLVVQSMSATSASVLWPLFVHEHFGWEAPEYALLILATSIFSTGAIAAVPAVEASCGRFGSALGALVLASLTGCFAFSFQQHSAAPICTHIVLVVIFVASLAFLEPSLKSLASSYMPRSLGGRSFGVLGTLAGVGSIAGNYIGTYLFELQYPAFASGGVLPFLGCSALLVVSAAALLLLSRHHQLLLPPSPKVADIAEMVSGDNQPARAGCDSDETLSSPQKLLLTHNPSSPIISQEDGRSGGMRQDGQKNKHERAVELIVQQRRLEEREEEVELEAGEGHERAFEHESLLPDKLDELSLRSRAVPRAMA